MAARYVFLKKTRTHAIVKVIGIGQVTIPLSALAMPDETLASPSANITFMHWSIDQNAGTGIITRGGTPIQYLYGTDEWALAQEAGFVDTENNTSDIVIDLLGKEGMMFLRLAKHGYKEPDTQAWDLDRNTLP